MENSANNSLQTNALLKREEFAVSLRKKKKQEILNNKRQKKLTDDFQDLPEN